MTFEELVIKVEEWGAQKGILSSSTPLKQLEKTEEEVEELNEALLMKAMGIEQYQNKKGVMVNTEDEVVDAFGDILVTLILGAKLSNVNLLEALQSAYNIISKRTGKMVDGKFVKDE